MRLRLNGVVVADDDKWLYDYFEVANFTPREVREVLDGNADEELVLEVNSGGGSVFAGFEIYSLLRAAKCRTVAELMLHLPSVMTEGNQSDHRASIKFLETVTESILNGYELKARGKASRDTLEGLMRRETWLTAQQAVELGLADEIIGGNEPKATSAVYNSLAITTVASLMAKYERAVRDGAEPAPGHPVEGQAHRDTWKAQARLELEKNRY